MFKKNYLSSILKNTILYLLPNPKKQPYLFPWLYCFIPLLLCLDKVIWQVIARQLAHIALKCKYFSLLYLGATLCHLAIDTAFILTNDTENTFQYQEIMTALALDINKAFDKIKNAWLIK